MATTSGEAIRASHSGVTKRGMRFPRQFRGVRPAPETTGVAGQQIALAASAALGSSDGSQDDIANIDPVVAPSARAGTRP